ncbi:hypothetical protein HBI56_149590 [Parastagonospora nodorum]|uniref:Uncharacterized protein n=1 Tax=Phaeosphaeria nodorum (strain SN15 / ATCC MYA-4574 / FGSC 10173) TaxID=321614 RepID=A0A7U2IBL1_PHANO|nr:hypothetical protein HBH56_075270 [Parastagonospora nodorum]QRD06803.1 hypothetical protein JI435_423740 [Parastagonospora nodorum SN15]KAH3927237.1 hypothetical protein HBH54_155510 [Parastagonospora nodorum]KAH3952133.1 hypothetical protein HBH53_052890 [Parastagonospora nodorum]KAH3981671.1 hypothetical protein HBH51_042220 [Parastagonospora nodorum]
MLVFPPSILASFDAFPVGQWNLAKVLVVTVHNSGDAPPTTVRGQSRCAMDVGSTVSHP